MPVSRRTDPALYRAAERLLDALGPWKAHLGGGVYYNTIRRRRALRLIREFRALAYSRGYADGLRDGTDSRIADRQELQDCGGCSLCPHHGGRP